MSEETVSIYSVAVYTYQTNQQQVLTAGQGVAIKDTAKGILWVYIPQPFNKSALWHPATGTQLYKITATNILQEEVVFNALDFLKIDKATKALIFGKYEPIPIHSITVYQNFIDDNNKVMTANQGEYIQLQNVWHMSIFNPTTLPLWKGYNFFYYMTCQNSVNQNITFNKMNFVGISTKTKAYRFADKEVKNSLLEVPLDQMQVPLDQMQVLPQERGRVER